jgi:hypothetical protein
MIRRRSLSWSLLPLAATGCGSAPAPDEDDILTRAAEMERPQPGLYRSTSTLTSFDLPEAGAQEADHMRNALGLLEPQEETVCLTAQEADDGFLPLLRDIQQGACTVEQFDAGSARMRAQLACPGQGGSASTVTMTGTGSQTSSRMELLVEQTGPAIPGGRLTMQFVVVNQRIGDC